MKGGNSMKKVGNHCHIMLYWCTW